MRVVEDFALGIRLAVGGGRISGAALLRLAMTTVGIALAVAVLLAAASIGNLTGEREARELGMAPITEPRAGVAPLHTYEDYWDVRGDVVTVEWVAPAGPSAPVPPGVDRLPGSGELVVSPDVADRLATGDESLRARLPGTVVGVIGKPGLVDPDDLRVLVGAAPEELAAEPAAHQVYGFGRSGGGAATEITTLLILAPVAVALLLPLLIFVTTASRMGAAQRERRLAGLRLVGMSAAQVRRVAAAETLPGALLGLVLGTALFLGLRPLVGGLELFGRRYFPEDLVPAWPLAVLVVLAVPALAVGAALFGLRRTVVEPLGVVRTGKPPRRRMWWRWLLTGAGGAMLLGTLAVSVDDRDQVAAFVLAVGSVLLLVGIAAVLPWAVERIVHAVHGGPPSWQLAIRRLQLDSGTASRVVSGLVVVLAGTILIQVLLASIGSTAPPPGRPVALNPAPVAVATDAEHLAEVRRRVERLDGVTATHVVRTGLVESADQPPGYAERVEVGDCAALTARATLPSCADGDAFYVLYPTRPAASPAAPAGPMRFVSYDDEGELRRSDATWRLPAEVTEIPSTAASSYLGGTLLVTPGALGDVGPVDMTPRVFVAGVGSPDQLADRVAAALSGLAWHASTSVGGDDETGRIEERLATFRAMLLTAALFVLSVAALSLLMLSVEQITERRRALAALSAAGVPVRVLAGASLWQAGVPVLVGVALSVAAGIGITLPTLRLADVPLVVDAPAVGGLVLAAVLAVLLVTALTLPLLRQATRLDALRAE
ncbi:FtsX-like permease family protein [Amycolatopsis arida]|uniref:FtsX-like permease family protein n=1 Tax=Amycolatopsis arida TaxID=587909 RepID=A0A1I5XXN7_9PSEU|nr:FtsX-like permease family protein [Amycolatopsis arida]TDX97207.1 FtsX-like permease family protein [Amycolatopsis arida]SFQ36630.1 FtsX-like permease family protein [Amycolatopsis arida]